jgi:hypothetical protein
MSYDKTSVKNAAEKVDRLSDRERMEALWARQRPDCVPIIPLTLGLAALNPRYSLIDFYFEPLKCVDASCWTNERIGG